MIIQHPTNKPYVLLNHQLLDCTHLSKPICIKETQQHGGSKNNEGRKEQLDKVVPQDVERIKSNDRWAETSEEHDEDSGRNKHNNNGDGGHNLEGQYQQLGY